MTNREIAAVFTQVADLLEFQNANPFRVRAYRNGARKIADLSEPLSAIVSDDQRELTDIEGVGKDLAEKIVTLLATDTLPMLDGLLAEIPSSVLDMMRVPGLGPKKAALLYNQLGIATLDQLRTACQTQQLQALKGFGAKTEQTILKGIGVVEQSLGRMRWADADEIVAELLEQMRAAVGVKQMEMAGSYRRGCETIGDLDLLIEATDVHHVMDQFGAFVRVAEVIARGETKMAVRLDNGLQIDLRVVPGESFGAALQYFTGSKDHNVAVRRVATRMGLKVNEWGVFRVADDGKETYLAGKTETDVYAAIDLPYFPPELREAREEFDWAASGELPKLITLDDIRADLHMHTTESDGKATLEEMVDEARARGREYIAITDHSQRVAMAGGLDATRLRRQWTQIDRLNQQLDDIVVLKGIECDILERGGMDLPNDVLAEADWVIASVHYGQQQSEQQITERILGALENPNVDIIAHPTGRLINRRDPYAVDMEQVFAAAARHGKLLELNANPARLDLHDIHCAAAKRHGVPVVISTDAHSRLGMEVMRHGVRQARRGGLTAADVANTLPLKSFRRMLIRG